MSSTLTTQQSPRQELIDDVKILLGSSMVDVELESQDYNTALKMALDRYRQRSSNAVEEAYMFLELETEQTEYYLPSDIIDIRQIFRRGLGGTTGGTQIDPFSLAYTNLYLLQAGAGGGYTAGLLTFELFYQYQEQAGRMFGRDIMFNWNVATKKLTLPRRFSTNETVLIWVTKVRPDDQILQDPFARPWIRSYTHAWCKLILAEAYGKYGQVLGPQGGTTIKAAELRTEGREDLDKLDTEILNYVDGGTPFGFVVLG
jgi:hypothetical protein